MRVQDIGKESVQDTIRALYLPPARFEDRSTFLDDLSKDRWHPVFAFPDGREGQQIVLPYAEAQALQAHGLAVAIPETGVSKNSLIDGPLVEHITRTITENPVQHSLSRLCRRWSIEDFQWRFFHPSNFTTDSYTSFQDALQRIDYLSPTTSDRYFDHLWRSSPGAPLPFGLRMAQVPNYDLGDRFPVFSESRSWLDDRQMVTRRQAVLHRDGLFTNLSSALASGELRTQGFLHNDVNRQMLPIDPQWWHDPRLVFDLKSGELKPNDSAPPGTPHFLGIRLTPSSLVQKPERHPESKQISVLSNARGPRALVRARVMGQIKADLLSGKLTLEQLCGDTEESLANYYGACRDTCRKARQQVLSEHHPGFSDK